MRIVPNPAAATVSLLLLLAACATAPAPGASSDSASGDKTAASDDTPSLVGLRLTLTGKTAPVLDANGAGEITLLREGGEAPVPVPFTNGGLAEAELAPGRYRLAGIGPLLCRGLEFEVGPAAARALGMVRADIVETEYYVALMSVAPAGETDLGALAARAGTEPAGVDARPLDQSEAAPCFVNKAGPAMTWQEVPLHQRFMLALLMAGICAGSVAAGGFCAFGAGAVGF